MGDTARFPAAEPESREPILTVDGLRTHIHTGGETIRAVDGVSFAVDRGETVCLVGESGCGKSVTCESLTGLIPQPPAEIVDGSVTFDGEELTGDPARARKLRGDRIGHVFQNPQHTLDPVYTIGEQIQEVLAIHDAGDVDPQARATNLLRQVGIPQASRRLDDYPHEFSGGMRQRAAIAIALAADPSLLIADEPTTAVDVTVQARLLELLGDLTDGGMAMLLVTHDLRVVAALADRVLVMYGGTIVERGPVEAIFDCPAHPYTQALFDSYDGLSERFQERTRTIPSDGCRFRDECQHATDGCETSEQPAFAPVRDDQRHAVSCVYYDDETVEDPSRILRDARRARPRAEVENDD